MQFIRFSFCTTLFFPLMISLVFVVIEPGTDGKIAIVGYYEFVAQHLQKVSKSSKNVQKSPKTPLWC